jgi:hypothetical protein
MSSKTPNFWQAIAHLIGLNRKKTSSQNYYEMVQEFQSKIKKTA